MRERLASDRIALAALVSGAVLVPFWYLPQDTAPIMLGRVLLAVAAAATLVVVLRRRRELGRPPRALVALCVGLAALGAVAARSVVVGEGCQCAGALSGYLELAGVAVLSAVLVGLRPANRDPLLLAAGAGAALTAVLALAGVDGIGPAAESTAAEGRLAGPVGNPNFLGFLIVCGLPLLLVARDLGRPARFAAAAGALAMLVALAATFSRGALVAAVIGAMVTITVTRRTRRAQILVLAAGIGGCALFGAVAYGAYDELRTEVNFTEARRDAEAIDRSGWDARAQGPIADGPARLANTAPDTLTVVSSEAGQGVSRPIGRIRSGERVVVGFSARVNAGPQRASYALQDNLRRRGGATDRAVLDGDWRRFRISWRPTALAPGARFYVWQTDGAGRIHVRDVRVHVGSSRSAKLGMRLRGSAVDELDDDFARQQRGYVRLRLDALELAGDAFLSAPVSGIGWLRFSEYAGPRLGGERINTHNEYARIFAELGLLGGLSLSIVLVTVLGAAWRARWSRAGAASLAVLLTGGVGLVFVNGLVTPTATLPLAMTAGVVVGAMTRGVR